MVSGWLDCRGRLAGDGLPAPAALGVLAAGGGEAVGLVLRLRCCCGGVACGFLRPTGLLFELGLCGGLRFLGGHSGHRALRT